MPKVAAHAAKHAKRPAHTKRIAKKAAKKVVKAKAPKVSAAKEVTPVVAEVPAVAAKVSKAKSPAKVAAATPEKKKLARTKTMAHTLKESKKILGDRRKIKKNRAVAAGNKAAAKKAHGKKPKAK